MHNPICHTAQFCNRNVHACTYVYYKTVPSGIFSDALWDWWDRTSVCSPLRERPYFHMEYYVRPKQLYRYRWLHFINHGHLFHVLRRTNQENSKSFTCDKIIYIKFEDWLRWCINGYGTPYAGLLIFRKKICVILTKQLILNLKLLIFHYKYAQAAIKCHKKTWLFICGIIFDFQLIYSLLSYS